MVTSAIAICLLSLGAFGLSGLTKQRTEECLPVCFCGVIGVLYGFYCFGAIRFGLPLVCVGILALFLFAWRKQKNQILSQILTPGVAVYLGLCVLFLAFFSGNHVSRHDELRLWGAVPKAIHASGKLQLGSEVPIFSTMQSYPPGLPLLGVFFTAFRSCFSEGALYVGYACFAMALLLPTLSTWKWKHWPLLAPAGLVLLLTPCVFTSHFGDSGLFGMTLFVDPLLGIAAGYVFFLAGHRPFRDGFHMVQFSLGLLVLCLLKSTGVVFGGAALATAILLDTKVWNKRVLFPVGAILSSVGGWKLLQEMYDVHELVPLRMHLLSDTAIQNILHALVSINVVAYRVPLGFFLSFIPVFAILLVLYYLASRLHREQSRKEVHLPAVGMLLSTAAFLYGYALIYGETLESFPRYMATPLLCLFTYILLVVFPALTQESVTEWVQKRSRPQKLLACFGGVLVGIAVLTVWCRLFPPLGTRENADRDAEKIRTAILQDADYGGSGWVYLVIAGDGLENSHYHHRMYFDLISDDINIRNGLAQTQVVIPGRANPGAEWAEELRDGYDYVYLLTLEDALIPVFAELSEDAPEANGLYRVCEADTEYGITLKRVQ